MNVWMGPGLLPPAGLSAELAGCQGLVCLLTDRVDRALLDAAPGLEFVSSMSVGVDHIDVQALSERGIPLGNTPGVLVDTTADTAFALLLESEPGWAVWLDAVRRFLPGAEGERFAGLSPRQREVLELIARGRDNAQIAARLALSEKTVRNQVSAIFDKLEVDNRARAIVKARDAGFGR